MKLDVLTIDNKKSSVLELNKEVFEADVRSDILHRMVNWQLAKRRSGNRKTQERSEVTGSRAKIVRHRTNSKPRHHRNRQGDLRPLKISPLRSSSK